MDRRDQPLRQVQRDFFESLENGRRCPLCFQHAQIYRRPLSISMIKSLVYIYRWYQENTGWLHVSDYLVKVAAGKKAAIEREFPRLRFWDLLERKPGLREDGSPRNGYYQITELGRQFVACGVSVPRAVWTYNDRLLFKDDKLVTIEEVVGRFDYRRLMAGEL